MPKAELLHQGLEGLPATFPPINRNSHLGGGIFHKHLAALIGMNPLGQG